MITYHVWDGDGDNSEDTTSLKKAEKIFESLKKRYSRVVLDKWDGTLEEGDYAGTIKEYLR